MKSRATGRNRLAADQDCDAPIGQAKTFQAVNWREPEALGVFATIDPISVAELRCVHGTPCS
jgi:hypothetical protein